MEYISHERRYFEVIHEEVFPVKCIYLANETKRNISVIIFVWKYFGPVRISVQTKISIDACDIEFISDVLKILRESVRV